MRNPKFKPQALILVPLLCASVGCSGGGGGDDGGGSAGRSTSTGVRIIHASIDEAPLSILIDGVVIQTAAYLETPSFAKVEAGSHPIWIDRANSTSERIFERTQEFADKTEYTAFVWGEARTNDRRVTLVPEVIAQPESGMVSVRFANGYIGTDRYGLRCGSELQTPLVQQGAITEYTAVTVQPKTCEVVSGDGGRAASFTLAPTDQSDVTVVFSGSDEVNTRFVRLFTDLD